MKIKTYESIYSDFLEVIKKENSQRQRQMNPNDFLEQLDFIRLKERKPIPSGRVELLAFL